MPETEKAGPGDGAHAGPVPCIREAIEISEREGAARIRIERPDTRIRRFLSFIFRLPSYKILVLDETGTEVLSLINGQRSFSDLVEHLAKTHSLEQLEAQHSMAAFLNRLSREGVIEVASGHRENTGG